MNKEQYVVIKVGHKTFTEQRILGNMIAILIEKNTPYKVSLTELGGTNINFEAIKNGEIDIYPEYTGTSFLAILGEKDLLSPREIFFKVKDIYNTKYNLDILEPLGFENTYALAVNKKFSEKYGINKISDLKFFPPYEAVITISNSFKDEYEDIERELSKLSNMFTNKDMQRLNLKVTEGVESEYNVAKDALKDKGLIE